MVADGKTKFSQTMRIDLIPDSPQKPLPGRKKRYVIKPSQESTPPSPTQPSEQDRPSGYQELLQSLYDAVAITDMSGKIINANLRAVEYLQYGQEELQKLSVFDIISGTDETLIPMLQENLKDERFTLIQAYCVRKDNSLFPSEIAVNKISLSEPCLCFFIRDITVRRQAEEMLRTEHNAIQNSADGIAIGNIEGHLEYVNPAIVRMWGYERPDELIGTDSRALFADPAKVSQALDDVMGSQQAWAGELKARARDGSQFDIQASATCNRNSDGEKVGVIFSFRDISDRKRAAEAEREAERRRVMLESFGAACHHLGQPATVLLANLGILQRRLAETDDPSVKELIEGSLNATERLGDILHKLNTVNEYRTTKYLDHPEGNEDEATRIIEI